MVQVRSLSNGFHPCGPLSVANYVVNPSMEVPDPTQTANPRINLITNPSFETDIDPWLSLFSSVTISRATDEGYFSNASLRVVVTDQTGVPVGPTYIDVLPNTDYTFSVYLKGSGAAHLAIGDHNGNQFAVSGSYELTDDWQRAWVTGLVPSDSTLVYLYVIFDTAYQTVWIDDAMLEESSTLNPYFDGTLDLAEHRTNICINPTFEGGTDFWIASGPTPPTISTTTDQHLFHSKALQINWPDDADAPVAGYTFSTTPGDVYTISAYLYTAPGTGPTMLLTDESTTSLTTKTGDWERLSYTFVAANTTTQLQLLGTSSQSGTTYVDGVLIEQSGAVGDYFDGSLPTFNNLGITQWWTGTPNASTSVQHWPVGKTEWQGPENDSSSVRYDLGPKYWTSSFADAIIDPSQHVSSGSAVRVSPSVTSQVPKLSQTFTIIDNTNYSLSFHVFLPKQISSSGIAVEFDCYDSTNVLTSVTTVPLLLSNSATNGFIRLATTYAAPAGTRTMTVSLRPTDQPSDTSDVYYFDRVLFERADTAAPFYFDGSFAGYCWSGVEQQSTTLQTATPDQLRFFATYAYVPPAEPPAAGSLQMGATAEVLPTSWPWVALTD